MTDLQELMACPFCGEHVDLCYNAGTEVYPQSWHVECKCGARMPGAWGSSTWRVVESEDNEAKQKVIAKWNLRSPAFAEMAAHQRRYLWLRDVATSEDVERFSTRKGTRLAADRVCDAALDAAASGGV